MTATNVPPVRRNTQTPKEHLAALMNHLEVATAQRRTVVHTMQADLAMAAEDLRAHEEMLESVRKWLEEGFLTS